MQRKNCLGCNCLRWSGSEEKDHIVWGKPPEGGVANLEKWN